MNHFFSVFLLLASLSSFASADADSFKVDFNISNNNTLVLDAFASYSPARYGEYHPCRTVKYGRHLKMKQKGNIISIKDTIPLISKLGVCKAPFSAIIVLLKNEVGNTEMISFVEAGGSASTPEKVSMTCFHGAIKRKDPLIYNDGIWSSSYIDFVCNSPQSTDSVATVFSFDPMKPFKLKEISISYSKELVPSFSTVLATEAHGPLQFLFSQNNWGLVGAYSPVNVLGFPEFEGINFVVTSVSFSNNELSPFVAVSSLDGKGPSFVIDNADKYDGCKTKRLLRTWPPGGGLQKVYCLE